MVLTIGIIFMLLGPVALYPYGGQGLPPFRCHNSSGIFVFKGFHNSFHNKSNCAAEMTTIEPPDTSTPQPSYIYKSVMTQNHAETFATRLNQNETDGLCVFFNSTAYECNEHGT